MKFYRYRMFLHISAAAEFSIHLVNLVNLILLEVEGYGGKNAEDVDFLFSDYWMFLKQLWTSFNHSWVDSETSRDSELVEHELVDEENHQTVEAPRIVLTIAKAKVTTSPSPDWDMDPCHPAVAPTMKTTQGSKCSFCLFNLKNEGFCIMEVWIPHVFSDKL